MKAFPRTTLGLLGACTLAPFLAAQTTSTAPKNDAPAPSPATAAAAATTATTSAPTTQATRFTTFEGASPAVLDAVHNAQAVANTARTSIGPAMTGGETAVARAVGAASGAIVQESRTARADVLAERQAALTRLRLAQSAPERERLVTELRTQTGQRMEEQRETARLVRDRLRELRDSTALTPKPGGS